MSRAVIVIIISTIIMLALCSFGMLMLMVIMNGMSEQQGLPYFIAYIVFSLAATAGMGTLAGWLITKNLPAGEKPKTWLIAAISVAAPLVIIGCLLLIQLIRAQF